MFLVVKVMDLDSLVAAISGQPAQTQASCASMMVANAFYFAAMKAVCVFPEVLKAVLDDIHLQVKPNSLCQYLNSSCPINEQAGLSISRNRVSHG